MRQSVRIFPILSVFLLSTPVYGVEIQDCSDFAEHKQILELGESTALRNREQPLSHASPLPGDLFEGFAGKSRKLQLPEDQIGKLEVSSDTQLWRAQSLAYEYEDVENFSAAQKVYIRMLDGQRRLHGPNSTSVAETLENLGMIEILLGTKILEKPISEQIPLTEADYYRERGWSTAAYWMRSAYQSILNATEQGDHSNTNDHWKKAMDFYQQGSDLRKSRSAPDPDLSYTLVILAALSEQQGNVKLASNLYLEALKNESKSAAVRNYSLRGHVASFPSAEKAFVDYCVRQKDWTLMRQLEPDLYATLSSSRQQDALVTLLSAYFNNNQIDDATRLFKKLLSIRFFGQRCGKLPKEIIIGMMDRKSNDLIPLLTQYLLVRATGYQRDKKFLAEYKWLGAERFPKSHSEDDEATELLSIAAAMEEHGWADQAQSVYEAVVAQPASQAELPELLQTAKFYERQRSYDKFASALSQAMELVSQRAPSNQQECEEKLRLLSPVIFELRGSCGAGNSTCKAVLDKALRLQTYFRTEGQKMQCMEMAGRLNDTAWELEKQGNYFMAARLYEESLSIKIKRLGVNDPETAAQYGELARVAAAQRDFRHAEALYAQGLAIYQKQPEPCTHDYGVMLESYAKLLEQEKLPSKANAVYLQARLLFNKLDQSSSPLSVSHPNQKGTTVPSGTKN